MGMTETVSPLAKHLSAAKEQVKDSRRAVAWTSKERETVSMELDKAFRFAVVLSWGDLRKVESPGSVRVEYQRESNSPLDHVTVWLDKGGGYCDRVCDYWTRSSPDHPVAIRFWKGHRSEQLARALAFIMENQDRFTAPTTVRKGLVIVYPPGDEESREASAWEEAEIGTNRGKEPCRDQAMTT